METEKTTLSNDLFYSDEKVETTCVSCRKKVKVKPILYGGGYIATCPECDKLAMNSTKEEVKKMRRV